MYVRYYSRYFGVHHICRNDCMRGEGMKNIGMEALGDINEKVDSSGL